MRSAESCALTVLKKLPSSPNSSCCGRSSRTPNSPRPRRVRPLRMTWIGRRISCANARPTTNTASSSATSAVASSRPAAPWSGRSRTSSVDTPMRIEPNCSPPSSERLAHLERLPAGPSRCESSCARPGSREQRRRGRRPAAAACPRGPGSQCGDGDAVRVADGRVGDVPCEYAARLEDRPQAAVAPAARRTGPPGRARPSCARWKIALASSSPRVRLSSRLHARQRRQVQRGSARRRRGRR